MEVVPLSPVLALCPGLPGLEVSCLAFAWAALPALAASFCLRPRYSALGEWSPIATSMTAKGSEKLTP
jgi:hypothetical protein